MVDESVPGADTTWQTQGVAYGAQIVAESVENGIRTLKYISRSNALVGAMMPANASLSKATGYMSKVGGRRRCPRRSMSLSRRSMSGAPAIQS
ncbi:MAG: hypothetical protein U0573_01595 [Phycisphaerales bacterium]